jgi:hypothetical protein
MRLARSRIEVNQLGAIDIGQVLSIGGPGEPTGRVPNERPVRKDCFDGEGLLRGLGGYRKSRKRGNK